MQQRKSARVEFVGKRCHYDYGGFAAARIFGGA